MAYQRKQYRNGKKRGGIDGQAVFSGRSNPKRYIGRGEGGLKPFDNYLRKVPVV